ncbi:MAG TPA: sensor histidine kinase [Candidatus Obscuribacterales bacterium]
MIGKADTVEVENPYVFWRAAQESEQSGDVKSAEMSFKSAVLAADNLPLAEYRRNFQEELGKHLSVPGYRTPPNIGPEELKSTYAELLIMPLAARVRLASFYVRQKQNNEALALAIAAANLRIDDWIMSQQLYCEIKHQLDVMLHILQASQPKSTQPSRNAAIRESQPRLQAYDPIAQSMGPDMSQVWSAQIKELRASQQADALATDSGAPLSISVLDLVESMHACVKRFVDDLPAGDRTRLGITISEPAFTEKAPPRKGAPGGNESNKSNKYYRFRAGTVVSTLSVRGDEDKVELFIVPTRTALQIGDVETEHCLHMRFVLRNLGHQEIWTLDKYPLYADDMRVNLRNTFKDIIQQSNEFYSGDGSSSDLDATHPLIKRLSELSKQRANLAEKIIYQQEMVQNRIARDIHDSVIADLLALKRQFEGEAVQRNQVIHSLEDVSQRLRNICSDLAPRDLQDWGLRTVVTDLVTTAAKRLNITGLPNVSSELPDMEYQVQLHIFRIVQECLNNMEKHAQASEFRVDLLFQNGILVVNVQDNGVGFDVGQKDTRKASQGGMGLDSIQERVELIRCFYPAELWIQSQPGQGTKTLIQINVSNKQSW